MAEPIVFYFEFSSPYGYVASRLIDDLAAKHGRTVSWRPILLGPIFKVTGAQPLVGIPLKGDYARRDLARVTRRLGIAFKMPDPFPFSAVAAARAFYWLDSGDPKAAHRLAQALYAAAFSGRDISKAETVADVASEIGLDGAAVAEGLASPQTKERTRAENDAAVALGVFGSPYIIVDGEPFWGSDRLDEIDRWLETGGW